MPKTGSCGNVYYQTIRVGIQSKFYQQNHSQMNLEIQINYMIQTKLSGKPQ